MLKHQINFDQNIFRSIVQQFYIQYKKISFPNFTSLKNKLGTLYI